MQPIGLPRAKNTIALANSGVPGVTGERLRAGQRRLLPAGRLQLDTVWFSNRGWSAPPPAFGANRSFGVCNELFLGAVLSNFGRAGSGEFFRNNQNDPGYQQ